MPNSTRRAMLALLTPNTPEAEDFAATLERALAAASDDAWHGEKYATCDEEREAFAAHGADFARAMDALAAALVTVPVE